MICYCPHCTEEREFPQRIRLPDLDAAVLRCECGEWRHAARDPCDVCALLDQRLLSDEGWTLAPTRLLNVAMA